jgi:V/A-type H+-transporting ATPase subunit D
VHLLDGTFTAGWTEDADKPAPAAGKLAEHFSPGKQQNPPAVSPSPEAERCREAFSALVPLAVELAVMRASLERLIREYIRTERRARALENVVLPEIEGSLRFMDEQLEAMDQEEAIRVRNAGR